MAAVVETPSVVVKPPKKEIEVVKVLAEKVKGHVKWYSASRHYGFISRNDDGGDLFVHRSVISAYSKRFPSLRTGEEVEFSVVETNQGIEATYVTGPGGQPVKGLRPLYRRNRTTSEPNEHDEPSQVPQADQNNVVDGMRQRQAGRRPKGFRRRGGGGAGRMRSSNQNEEGHENGSPRANEPATDGEGKSANESGAPGESPNRTVPRQRRRPQRRGVRHRSAPTEGEATGESQGDGLGTSGEQQGQINPRESRNQVRPFRRPFRPRGGSLRYTNGYSNAPGQYAEYNDGTVHGSRQSQVNGKNGFERNGGIPRRRGYGVGHYRGGPRRRRPEQEGHVTINGDQPAGDDDATATKDNATTSQEPDTQLVKHMEKVDLSDATLPDASAEGAGSDMGLTAATATANAADPSV